MSTVVVVLADVPSGPLRACFEQRPTHPAYQLRHQARELAGGPFTLRALVGFRREAVMAAAPAFQFLSSASPGLVRSLEAYRCGLAAVAPRDQAFLLEAHAWVEREQLVAIAATGASCLFECPRLSAPGHRVTQIFLAPADRPRFVAALERARDPARFLAQLRGSFGLLATARPLGHVRASPPARWGDFDQQ
jgi:hypothetical protein